MTMDRPTGDDLVEVLAALANPVRLRIVAKLAGGRDYVSHLARELGVSRPLLHMHLSVSKPRASSSAVSSCRRTARP